jgi:hypothetical protein
MNASHGGSYEGLIVNQVPFSVAIQTYLPLPLGRVKSPAN